MRVIVLCERAVSKNGSAIRAQKLPLVGFGRDEATALAELEKGVRIWCRGLQRQGLLDAALGRAGLSSEQDGRDDLDVVTSLEAG